MDCQPIEWTLAPATIWQMKAVRRNYHVHIPMYWKPNYNNTSRGIFSKELDSVTGRPLPRNYLTTTPAAQVVQRRI